MHPGSPDNPFDLLVGFIVFLSFVSVTFCVVSLRNHVDESEIRKEESVARVFRIAPLFLPERVLTATGRKRAKFAKTAVIVLAVSVAILVIRGLASGKL
jgi:hypothetical protein